MGEADRRCNHVLVFMQPCGKHGHDNDGYKRRLRYFNSPGCMRVLLIGHSAGVKSNTRKL